MIHTTKLRTNVGPFRLCNTSRNLDLHAKIGVLYLHCFVIARLQLCFGVQASSYTTHPRFQAFDFMNGYIYCKSSKTQLNEKPVLAIRVVDGIFTPCWRLLNMYIGIIPASKYKHLWQPYRHLSMILKGAKSVTKNWATKILENYIGLCWIFFFEQHWFRSELNAFVFA